MSRKKLKIIKHYQSKSEDGVDNNGVTLALVFNRPLSSLEAAGIVYMIEDFTK